MLFQQDNAIRGVQELPCPAGTPDVSPIELVWDLKRELTLFPESATITVELQQQVQDTCGNLPQDDIRHLYDCLHARIHACFATAGQLCILACVFHLV